MTQEYRVTGPVMVMMTTTAIELDGGADESLRGAHGGRRPRADAGHPRKQREAQTVEGILARQDRGAVMALHQNARGS